MYFKLILFSFFILLGKSPVAQIALPDSRDNALGNASTGSLATNGLPLNIAALNWNKYSYVCLTVYNKYAIKELSQTSIAASKRLSESISIQAAFCKVGDKYFSEQFIETGVSKKLGQKFSAGIKIRYHQWILNESTYSSSNTFIPEAGIFASPFKNINVGVVIRNPVRVRMNAIEKKKLPSQILSGISVNISTKVLFACSLKKQTDLPISVHTGIEYCFHPKLFLRVGYHTIPASETFGFGLYLGKLQIDLSGETHPLLGISSSVSLTYRI